MSYDVVIGYKDVTLRFKKNITSERYIRWQLRVKDTPLVSIANGTQITEVGHRTKAPSSNLLYLLLGEDQSDPISDAVS
jgi:hypothetical protein